MFIHTLVTDLHLGREEWLTADPETGNLFCWCCLLFSRKKSKWGDLTQGFDKHSHISDGINKHKGLRTGKGTQATECAHMEAAMTWKLYLRNTDDAVSGTLYRMGTLAVRMRNMSS